MMQAEERFRVEVSVQKGLGSGNDNRNRVTFSALSGGSVSNSPWQGPESVGKA